MISGGGRGGVVVLQHFIHDGREEVLVEQFLRMRTVKLLVTLMKIERKRRIEKW